MSARLLNLLDRRPLWAGRGLMIVLPLALLGLLVAGFVLAPHGSGHHAERANATGRLLPPTATSARTRPAARTTQSPVPARDPRPVLVGYRAGRHAEALAAYRDGSLPAPRGATALGIWPDTSVRRLAGSIPHDEGSGAVPAVVRFSLTPQAVALLPIRP